MTPSLKTPFKHATDTDTPLYGQIMGWLQTCIEAEFEDGQRFLTERELMALLNVSQASVRRALQELVDRGLLRRHVGRGTFVQKLKANRQLGIIVPKFDSVILMGQISCFADLCDEFDCNLRVYHLNPRTVAEELSDGGENFASTDMARLLSANPAEERMVLLGHSREATLALYGALDRRGFRTVSAMPFADDYPGDSVTVDIRHSAKLAIDHLLELGHRRIAILVNEPTALPSINLRLNYLCAYAGQVGVDAVVVDCQTHLAEDSFESALRKMPDLLKIHPAVTAIIAISGAGAQAVLRHAGAHGLRIPQDVSLLAFDDLRGFDRSYPTVSAIRIDSRDYARRILQMIWAEDVPRPSQHHVVQLNLIARESTAPQRMGGSVVSP